MPGIYELDIICHFYHGNVWLTYFLVKALADVHIFALLFEVRVIDLLSSFSNVYKSYVACSRISIDYCRTA